MQCRLVVRTIVTVLLLSAYPTLSALAQGVGAIGGTIADASGGVLPGVTVTLSSAEGTVGGNREAVTDERGSVPVPAPGAGHLQGDGGTPGIPPRQLRTRSSSTPTSPCASI